MDSKLPEFSSIANSSTAGDERTTSFSIYTKLNGGNSNGHYPSFRFSRVQMFGYLSIGLLSWLCTGIATYMDYSSNSEDWFTECTRDYGDNIAMRAGLAVSDFSHLILYTGIAAFSTGIAHALTSCIWTSARMGVSHENSFRFKLTSFFFLVYYALMGICLSQTISQNSNLMICNDDKPTGGLYAAEGLVFCCILTAHWLLLQRKSIYYQQ